MSVDDPSFIAPAFDTVVNSFTTLPAGITMVAPADPYRIAIIFSVPSGTNAVIHTDASVAVTKGFAVQSGLAPQAYSLTEYGGFVQHEFWAVAGAPGCNLTVFMVRYLPYRLSTGEDDGRLVNESSALPSEIRGDVTAGSSGDNGFTLPFQRAQPDRNNYLSAPDGAFHNRPRRPGRVRCRSYFLPELSADVSASS